MIQWARGLGKSSLFAANYTNLEQRILATQQQESEEVTQIRCLRKRARIKLMNKIKKIATCKGITNKQRTWRNNQAIACDKLRDQIKRYTVSLQLLGVKHE